MLRIYLRAMGVSSLICVFVLLLAVERCSSAPVCINGDLTATQIREINSALSTIRSLEAALDEDAITMESAELLYGPPIVTLTQRQINQAVGVYGGLFHYQEPTTQPRAPDSLAGCQNKRKTVRKNSQVILVYTVRVCSGVGATFHERSGTVVTTTNNRRQPGNNPRPNPAGRSHGAATRSSGRVARSPPRNPGLTGGQRGAGRESDAEPGRPVGHGSQGGRGSAERGGGGAGGTGGAGGLGGGAGGDGASGGGGGGGRGGRYQRAAPRTAEVKICRAPEVVRQSLNYARDSEGNLVQVIQFGDQMQHLENQIECPVMSGGAVGRNTVCRRIWVDVPAVVIPLRRNRRVQLRDIRVPRCFAHVILGN